MDFDAAKKESKERMENKEEYKLSEQKCSYVCR